MQSNTVLYNDYIIVYIFAYTVSITIKAFLMKKILKKYDISYMA